MSVFGIHQAVYMQNIYIMYRTSLKKLHIRKNKDDILSSIQNKLKKINVTKIIK